METLIHILRLQTQELAVEFVAKTIEWATHEYNSIANTNENQIKEQFGFKNKSGFYEHTHKSYNIAKKYRKITSQGLDVYVEKAQKDALNHYKMSLEKLAFRINSKGLSNDIKVVTARVGVNLETTITDGQKTVRAFTVMAWGEIQKPHYRYLVK